MFDSMLVFDGLLIPIDKNSINAWHPVNNTLIENKRRNT